MKHYPYSLYRKKSKKGYIWYVRFWNYGEQRYILVRSTGVLAIGKKGRLRDADNEAKKILETLSHNPTKKTVAQYLTDFWASDGKYAEKCNYLRNNPLRKRYLLNQQGDVKRHIATYPEFCKLPIIELTPGKIEDWMIWMVKKGSSNRLINTVRQTMKIAIDEGIFRQELLSNPINNVSKTPHKKKEKGILLPEEIAKLKDTLTDKNTKIAVYLGLLCGMRIGEVRGIHYEDITEYQVEDKTVYEVKIQHNYQNYDGDVKPKYDSVRGVPLPDIIVQEIGNGTGYIFKNRFVKYKGRPCCAVYLSNLLKQALIDIGITEDDQNSRNLSFQSLRHTFITVGQEAGIPAIMMQALAGHKSLKTTEIYTHAKQIINIEKARERLKSAMGF